jgi:hypothetical protein
MAAVVVRSEDGVRFVAAVDDVHNTYAAVVSYSSDSSRAGRLTCRADPFAGTTTVSWHPRTAATTGWEHTFPTNRLRDTLRFLA